MRVSHVKKGIDVQFFALPGVNTDNVQTTIRNYYDRVALAKAIPFLTFRRWGQKRPIPPNHGRIIEFKRWGRLAPALTSLTEGITPVGSSLDYETITATIAQYGDWIPITDQVQDLSIDPVLTEAIEQLGEQQGETLDLLGRNELLAGSNVFRANGVASRNAVVAKVNSNDFDKIIRSLKVNLAKRVNEQISASVKIETTPIRSGYIAIVSPYTTTDLESISGYVSREKYAQDSALEGEVGSYKEIRFIETTHAMVYESEGGTATAGIQAGTGGKVNVYATIIFGKEAYGEVPLSNQSHSIIVKTHNKGDTKDTSDPLNQRGTAGWKCYYTAKILNDDWLIRYEHAVGA